MEINNIPYLKNIFVITKTNLIDKKEINSDELQKFLKSNSSFQNEEISLNSQDNMSNLLYKINSAVNEADNNLPCNYIFEADELKTGLINFDGSLSIILLGDSTVGKTCFYKRYFKNQFTDSDLATVGIEKENKHVKIKDKSFKISLWDTAGQERFRQLLPKNYYNNADGILLLFDLTKEKTFENVSKWVKDITDKSNKSKVVDGKETGITLYIIGNKMDLPDREVTKEQIKSLINSLNVKYFEVSCKTNMNIPETILNMIMDCYMKYSYSGDTFSLDNSKKKKKKKCC